jgi:butyrate kinase
MRIVLTINPGSTSTKIALFEESKQIFVRNIQHSLEDLKRFPKISDQIEYRTAIVRKELYESEIPLKQIRLVIGRGGLIKTLPPGVIPVNEALLKDLADNPIGEHASNLGGLIAYAIAEELTDARAFIVDPVMSDELDEIATITGIPEIRRKSLYHPLNHKAVARLHASSHNSKYENLNLIVAHMGGGITIAAHSKGRIVDVNNGLDGEGPLTPERAGTIPAGDMVTLCFSGKYTEEEIRKMLNGKGGYVAWFGTNNAYQVEKDAESGNELAELIQDAMAYQVSKFIGAMSTVLKGEVDAILLTGGLAYGKPIVDNITERVRHLAPVFVYPGEDEMRALALNGFMILNGEATEIIYS